MKKKKVRKSKKTTRSFKDIMLMRDIIPGIRFMGTCMLWPYTWNGERRYARIKLSRLVKIVEFDVTKL